MNPFRASNGWVTRGLFVDQMKQFLGPDTDVSACIYWFHEKQDPSDTRPSFKEMFLRLQDPTGYEISKLYLGDYSHYKFMLDRCPWFREAVEEWVVEIQARFKAEALKRIRKLSEGDTETIALAAARFLATESYNPKSGRGRPAKAEVNAEVQRQAKILSQTEEDFKRINVINLRKV